MKIKGFYNEFRRRPTLPRSLPRSTIGAEELNFRVRDGSGCTLLAIATEKTRKGIEEKGERVATITPYIYLRSLLKWPYFYLYIGLFDGKKVVL